MLANDVSSPEDSPWAEVAPYSSQTAAWVIECELDQLGELTCRMAEPRTDQTQVWNPNNAFCYPCLTTNWDDEVGISLACGGVVPMAVMRWGFSVTSSSGSRREHCHLRTPAAGQHRRRTLQPSRTRDSSARRGTPRRDRRSAPMSAPSVAPTSRFDKGK